jgi:outer membrane lipoprotein SlyB
MKHLHLFGCGLAILLGAVGCETPSGRTDYTGGGALTGAAVGAGTGAIIGGATRHAGEGALIGGAVGALSGAIIGSAIQQSQRERIQEQNPQTLVRVDRGQPLTLADVKALTKAGVSDEVIISQSRTSRTVYRLAANEIIELHDAGVSNKVIDFMVNTPSLYPPPAPPRRYYY